MIQRVRRQTYCATVCLMLTSVWVPKLSMQGTLLQKLRIKKVQRWVLVT